VVTCPPWACAEAAGAVLVTVLVAVTVLVSVTGGAVTAIVSTGAVTVTVRGGSSAADVDGAVLLAALGVDDVHPATPREARATRPVARMIFFMGFPFQVGGG
jgi:hypothetical protein